MPPTRRSRALSTHEAEDRAAQQQPPPSPPPPELQALRRHWKWAATSQFLTLFRPLLGAEQILLADVEQDLAAGTRLALPRLMGRLLSQLNQDRKITSENWQPYLRRQFARRAPEASPWPPLGRQQSQAAPTPASEQQQDVSEDPEREQKQEPEDVKMETSTEPNAEGAEAPDPFQATSEEPPVKKEEQEPDQDQEPPQEVDWFTFPLETKLDSLHALCEWFFHNPNRIRQTMKDDDEYAQWRMEPVGYDAELDAYWFLGGDRLWRQRRQNAPIRVRTGIKRKRPPAGGGQRKRVALEAAPVAPAKRPAGRSTRTSARAGAEALPMETRRERASRSARRGDDDAWQEVPDDWLRTDTASATPEVNGHENGTEKANGVVHAKQEEDVEAAKENGKEDEKAEVAEEDKEKTIGLKEETKTPEPPGDNGVSDEVKAMLGLDSDSELTELSSDEDGDGGAGMKTEDEGSEGSSSSDSEDSEDEYPEFFSDYRPPSSPPPGFVEWETVCVTKSEWAEFPTRFENSSNRHERALHKRLLNDVLPIVMDVFHQEEERVRALAKTAESSIKRSSRLAIKESERLQQEQTRTQSQAPGRGSGAGAAKADRAARAELRARRGEEERIKRELAEAEDLEDDLGSRESVPAEPAPAATGSRAPAKNANNGVNGKRKRPPPKKAGDKPPPKKAGDKPPPKKKQRTTYEEDDEDDEEDEDDDSGDDYEDARDADYNEEDDEDWYLDCEICGKKGLNVNDGLAVACCEGCNKWQHMKCHDEVDERAGRKPRNWEEIDFTCRACATKTRSKSGSPRKSNAHAGQQAQQSTFQVQQQMQQRHPQHMQQHQHNPAEALLQQMATQVEASRRPDGTFDPVLVEKYRAAQAQVQAQVQLQRHMQQFSQMQQNLQAQLNQAQASGQYNAQQLQHMHAEATHRLQQQQQQIQSLQMQLQGGFSQPALARSSSFPGAGIPTGGQVQGAGGQMAGGQGPHNSAEMVALYHQQQQREALIRQQMALQQQQQQQRQPLQSTQSAPNVMSMSNPQMQQYMTQQQPQQHLQQQLRPSSSSGMLAGMTSQQQQQQQQQQQAFTLAQIQQQRRNSSHSPVQAQFGPSERTSQSPHLHQQHQQQQPQVKLVPPGHPSYQQQQQQLLNLQAMAQTHGLAALTQQQMLYLQAFQLQQAASMNAGPSVASTSGAQTQQIALQHQQMLQQQAARQQQQQQWVGGSQDMLPPMGDQMRMMNQARVASQGGQFVQQRQSPILGQHASPSLQQMSQQSSQGMSQVSLPPMASQSPVQSQQQYMQQMQSPSLGPQQSGSQYMQQQQMQSPSLGPQQSGQFAAPSKLAHQSSMPSPAQMHRPHSQSPIDASFRQQTQTPPQPQVTSISPHQLMNHVPTPTPPPIPESTSQS